MGCLRVFDLCCLLAGFRARFEFLEMYSNGTSND